jgi:hypothetical protein
MYKVSRFSIIVSLGVVLWLGAEEAHAGSAVVSGGSVGIVKHQSIRVSISSPAPQGSPTPEPVLATVHLLDTNGDDLAVSPTLTVGPGQTMTYVVSRAALSPPGDPGTGRLQVRAETYLEVPSQPPGQAQVVITLTELVDEPTGKHSGMIGDTRTVISGG